MAKKIIDFILYPWTKYKAYIRNKKQIENLRKRDPFIYK